MIDHTHTRAWLGQACFNGLIVRLILDCTGKEFGCEVLCTFASAHFTLFIILVVLGDALSDLVYNDIT